jgi:hypothetical protein
MKINSRSSLRTTTTWTALFLAAATLAASACPACYGDTSGSKMGNAAQVGIFAMVVIMFGMLSAVGGFIWYLAYRAKHPLPDYDELLREDGGDPGHDHLPAPQPETP